MVYTLISRGSLALSGYALSFSTGVMVFPNAPRFQSLFEKAYQHTQLWIQQRFSPLSLYYRPTSPPAKLFHFAVCDSTTVPPNFTSYPLWETFWGFLVQKGECPLHRKVIPRALEQPFVNYYLTVDRAYNTSALSS